MVITSAGKDIYCNLFFAKFSCAAQSIKPFVVHPALCFQNELYIRPPVQAAYSRCVFRFIGRVDRARYNAVFSAMQGRSPAEICCRLFSLISQGIY